MNAREKRRLALSLPSDRDFGFAVIAAVRYCFGRQSYAPGLMQGFVKRYWELIDERTRVVLLRDVTEEIAFAERAGTKLGADFDHRDWCAYRDWLREQGVRLPERPGHPPCPRCGGPGHPGGHGDWHCASCDHRWGGDE